MQTFQQSYRGLSLLFVLNWDRLMFLAAILSALMLGAFLGEI
ncbi:MAG: hypothetical protein AAF408_06330 [Pseudomonadota bacterium]